MEAPDHKLGVLLIPGTQETSNDIRVPRIPPMAPSSHASTLRCVVRVGGP